MIPDFNDAEIKVIHDTLKERYGEEKETQRCDVELRHYPDDREITECPSVYWEHDGCHFILSKVDDRKFFSQFFYNDREQFGTGTKFYTDLFNCLVATLQVQADHEREKNMQKDSQLIQTMPANV